MKYGNYGRITLSVILLSILTSRGYGTPLTTASGVSGNGGIRSYSAGELKRIVAEISEAAEQEIERAAAEAAKAEALAGLEREAAALAEARCWQGLYTDAQDKYADYRKRALKNGIVAGCVCFLGGLVFGAGSVLLLQGAR